MKHSRRRFNLPPMSLQRSAAQPMYVQFSTALERAIRDGQLPAGSRLPSTRAAAEHFGVSRNTIVTAYEILAARDLIESDIGSGTRVRGKRMIPPVRAADWKSLIREARYPARTTALRDPDGNVLRMNY